MQNTDLASAKNDLFLFGFLIAFLLFSIGVSILFLNIFQTPTVSFPARVASFELESAPTPLPSFSLTPQRVQILSANIDVNVEEGGIENGEWILSPKSAYYLPKQYLGDNNLNTIIYAHKRPNLFINLNKVQIGDEILVTNTENKEYFYKVRNILVVDPNDLESLRSEGENFITLITCDGSLDKERLVVKAEHLSFTSFGDF